MKKFLIGTSILAIGFVFFACGAGQSSGKIPPGDPAASTLAAIRANYTPIPCFTSRFDITMRQTGRFAKRARGELRVDNQQDRMRLVIKDRILGLSLSEMTLLNGNVYLKNIGQDRQVIPRDQFRVAGLGNNTIVLPFSLFQDLLYGKIPDEVYTRYDSARTENGALVVKLSKPEANYSYRFLDNRLREMQYAPPGPGLVDVALAGEVPATSFPKKIDIAMKNGEHVSETMNIVFHSVDTQAHCTDGRFPVN